MLIVSTLSLWCAFTCAGEDYFNRIQKKTLQANPQTPIIMIDMTNATTTYRISTRGEYFARLTAAEKAAYIEGVRASAKGANDPRLKFAAEIESLLVAQLARERKTLRRMTPKTIIRRITVRKARRSGGPRGIHVSRANTSACRTESGGEPPQRGSSDDDPPASADLTLRPQFVYAPSRAKLSRRFEVNHA